MSLARQIAAVGQLATAAIEEEVCRNLRTSLCFRAKIEPIEDIALNTELGRDARASDYFHVRDATVEILAGDRIEAFGNTFVILPGNAPDHAASLHLKFTAMQLGTQDS